jgi:glycosyltransferase involved in cell wall biosynthesis
LKAIDRRLGGEKCSFMVNVAGQVKDFVPFLPAREAEIFSRPWVQMQGFVQNIDDFYADMDLILSPVTMGTGINVKTVQAMAYGLPLLTTTCGSKGIETGDPMHTHENLDELASSIFRLLNQPEELARLAALSRSRFDSFYKNALSGFSQILLNEKLLSNGINSHGDSVKYRP